MYFDTIGRRILWRTTFLSEQKERLREIAENTYAENWVNALSEEITSQKITEADALKRVNTIPYKSVRGIAQKKLEEELHIMGLQKQEEEEKAYYEAMNDLNTILTKDIPNSDKLRHLYLLHEEAEKKAKKGKNTDNIFYNTLQKNLQKNTTFSSYFMPPTFKKK